MDKVKDEDKDEDKTEDKKRLTMASEYDEMGDAVFDFMEGMESPFTLSEFFKRMGIKKAKRKETEISEVLQLSGYFVFDGGKYYPRSSFLGNIPVRIQPAEFEIEKRVLIPGHRLLPFHPPGRAVDEIELLYNGSALETKTMYFKMKDIQTYFSLMDLRRLPIVNIEDILEENSDLAINVYDLCDFYKQNNFKFGDTVVVRPVNVHEGIFSLHYDSMENYRAHIFEIKRKDREFLDALKKVMEKKLEFPNVEKQLLYTYFYLKDNAWTIPGSALGPLLNEITEIRFSPLPNGRKVFHFADQDVEDLDVYPDLADFFDEDDDSEIELDTIDGILEYLNNTNTGIVVRALLLDRIAENEEFDYKAIETYLFAGLEKPYIPKELHRHFKQLVKDEYLALKECFNPAYAFLPVTIARKKILEAELLISKFLRSLDARNVRLEELPKNDIMHLMELDQTLLDLLFNLEMSQLQEQNGSADGHRIYKIVDRLSTELPRVFEVIMSKIG